MKLLKCFCLPLLLFPLLLRADEPVVLVTVKPLAWLVQAIAPPGSRIEVLVPEGRSPHDYQLRPADVAHLGRSALLVWVGPGLEPWLVQVAARRPAAHHFALLPMSLHEAHDHDGHGHEEEHDEPVEASVVAAAGNDPHVWLDPLALREQIVPLALRLKQVYPAQADDIDRRAARFMQDLTALDAEIAAQFAPVAARGFVVYHDGYQRLVQRYHLNQRSAVWRHESVPAGARERAALLALLRAGDVQCLFYEPEHGADAVAGWLGTAAKSVRMVELDPLGQDVADGADSYPRFLRGLAGKIVGCLR